MYKHTYIHKFTYIRRLYNFCVHIVWYHKISYAGNSYHMRLKYHLDIASRVRFLSLNNFRHKFLFENISYAIAIIPVHCTQCNILAKHLLLCPQILMAMTSNVFYLFPWFVSYILSYTNKTRVRHSVVGSFYHLNTHRHTAWSLVVSFPLVLELLPFRTRVKTEKDLEPLEI